MQRDTGTRRGTPGNSRVEPLTRHRWGVTATSGPARVFLPGKPERPAFRRAAAGGAGRPVCLAAGWRPPCASRCLTTVTEAGGPGRCLRAGGAVPARWGGGHSRFRGGAPPRACAAAALRPVSGRLNAEVCEVWRSRRRGGGARWRGARRRERAARVRGSGEAWAKPRGRSRTIRCSLRPRPPGFQNTPTGWICGSSSSWTWRCFCSCTSCPDWFTWY